MAPNFDGRKILDMNRYNRKTRDKKFEILGQNYDVNNYLFCLH